MSAVLLLGLLWSVQRGVDGYNWDTVTALDEYVQRDDGYFSWAELAQYKYDGVTIYIINMTSQKWQDESFVSRSIWWHLMGIAIPDRIRHHRHGFLYVDGDWNDNTRIPPSYDRINIEAVRQANDSGTCGGYILHVPNQPVVFENDPTQMTRFEDSIIAWTWRTYIDSPHPDQTVILRMPMTKAAKRGLDTIHEVTKAKVPSADIDKFLVSGASKRGWTSWSLACTDRRVVAIIPELFSMLNMPVAMQNHFRNMNGGYSFALASYWMEGVTQELWTHTKMDGVYSVEDVYRYKERLEGVYKLQLLATGDEFFVPDDSLYWWNEMPEPKWMMMMPNAGHTDPHHRKAYETIISFWISVINNITLPSFTWTMAEMPTAGLIVSEARPPPRKFTAFSATTLSTDSRRDFRLHAVDDSGAVVPHPVRWKRMNDVIDFGDGLRYGVKADKVDGEWVGFLMQGTWDGPPPTNYRLTLTTQVNIIPDTRPRRSCVDRFDCSGIIV